MFTLRVTDRDGAPHVIEAEEGKSIMVLLRDADMGIEAACGGCCSCATCHVFIDPAGVSACGPRQEQETDLLDGLVHFDDAHSRLSCQITFDKSMDGLSVRLAPEE